MADYRREHLQRTLGDRYAIGSLLGQGAFASVYLAENRNLGRLEAIKVLSDLHDEKPDFAQRFAEESRLVASLDHPHIVKVFDSGQADGLFWTSMQYIDGPTLDRELVARGALDPDAVLRLAIPILDALDYSHRRGVIHRDIKPSNLILSSNGQVYLMDFGIAKSLASSLKTATGNLWGTPEYMAPEVVNGSPVDGRTDIYSLGTTLYEMMAGRRPFKSTDFLQTILRRVQEEPAPPSEYCQEVTMEQDALILRMIARLPEHRYQTAREARGAIVDLTGSEWQTPWGRPLAKTKAGPSEPPKGSAGRAWSTLWRNSSGWLLSKGSKWNQSRSMTVLGILLMLSLVATAYIAKDVPRASTNPPEFVSKAESGSGAVETSTGPLQTPSSGPDFQKREEGNIAGAEEAESSPPGVGEGDRGKGAAISIISALPTSDESEAPAAESVGLPSQAPSQSASRVSSQVPSSGRNSGSAASPSPSSEAPLAPGTPPAGFLQPVVPPKILEETEFQLPEHLQSTCDSVVVIVAVTVEADGSVGKVRTLGETPAECAEPVEAAVRAYRFSPALDSEDRPVRGSTTLSFRLGGK